jgi:hypothetical protein
MRRFVRSGVGRGAALALAGWIALAACGGGPAEEAAESQPTAAPTAPLTVTPVPESATPEPGETPTPSVPMELETADGAIKLLIPEGALPDGVDPEDVKITEVDPEDVPAEFENTDDLTAIQLEPQGLELKIDVIMEVEMEAGPGTVPWVWEIHAGEDDPDGPPVIAGTSIEILPDTAPGVETIRMEIDRFNWFVIDGAGGRMTLDITRPRRPVVGVPFPVVVKMAFGTETYRTTLPRQNASGELTTVRVLSLDPILPWKIVEGVFQPSRAFGDERREDAPGPTAVDGEVYEFETEFICLEEDLGVLDFTVRFSFREKVVEVTEHFTGPKAGQFEEEIFEVAHPTFFRIVLSFECVSTPATPTPTPTPVPPTPTATATPTETPTPAMEQVTPSTLEIGGYAGTYPGI